MIKSHLFYLVASAWFLGNMSPLGFPCTVVAVLKVKNTKLPILMSWKPKQITWTNIKPSCKHGSISKMHNQKQILHYRFPVTWKFGSLSFRKIFKLLISQTFQRISDRYQATLYANISLKNIIICVKHKLSLILYSQKHKLEGNSHKLSFTQSCKLEVIVIPHNNLIFNPPLSLQLHWNTYSHLSEVYLVLYLSRLLPNPVLFFHLYHFSCL